jgi:hypothetical protein
MNISEAKALRDKGKFLIGQKGHEFEIIDVIVIPSKNTPQFFDEYRRSSQIISNDDMIDKYPSEQYAVNVIYHADVNVIGEDISTYQDRL